MMVPLAEEERKVLCSAVSRSLKRAGMSVRANKRKGRPSQLLVKDYMRISMLKHIEEKLRSSIPENVEG